MKNKRIISVKIREFRKLIGILAACLLVLPGRADVLETNAAYSQKVRITLNLSGTTLKEAFKEIERNSEFVIFYYEGVVDATRRVRIQAKEQPVDKILDTLFEGTDNTYKIVDKQIYITKKSAAEKGDGTLPAAPQQKKTVTGVLTDAAGEPLIGATVSVKGTTHGVTTDINGTYILNDVGEGDIIQFRYIGYKTEEKVYKGEKSMNICLAETSTKLEDVVVIGYGTQKKGSIATSITSIKAEKMQNRPLSSMAEALQGQVPGLSIVSSGQPGRGASISLRGATSLNGVGSPLILVDGVPGEINYLNSEDIESVNVLKDAASAAIYGSRASNGVILVTTKRGRVGKPTFRYNGMIGVNTPTSLPKMCSSARYARAINEAEQNIGRSPIYSAEEIALYENGTDPNRYPNTNWLDLAIQNSLTTRHGIDASGGTEAVKYLVSAGMDHQTGVLPGNEQNIFNVRTNTDIAISKKFNLSFDMNYQLRKVDQLLDIEDTYARILSVDPTKVAYYTDGSYGYNAGFFTNPLVDLYESGKQLWNSHEATGLLKFDYRIIDGLKFTGLANVKYTHTSTTNRSKKKFYKEFFTQEEFSTGENGLSERRQSVEYYNLQALLTYQKTFGKHSIDALAGYQQENEKSNWISAGRSGYPTNLIWVLDPGPKDNWSNGGNAEHWAIASVIGRLNYEYDNKYILSASFRSDASSRFAKENRWSTFPAVALAWRVSKERFMEKTAGWLDDWKVRVSWGQNGSATGLGLYPSYTTIAMDGIVLNNTWRQTARLNAIGNTELGWERTEMVNIATDITLLNNRLSFTGEYYIKTSKDILIGLPVPMEYGFGNSKVNIGKMRNNGWEWEVRWSDEIGNFKYGVSGNLSDNRNKVVDLAGTGPWVNGYTDVGLPFNSFYGYESLGLFQSDEEVAEAPFQNAKTGKGDVRYKDQNGDNKINADDRVVIGEPYPHFLFGFNLNAAYKGFDLNVLFQGVGQKDLILNDKAVRPLYDSPLFEHQLDYWSETNKDARYPRLLNKDEGSHNYLGSDFWKMNAGYLRLKNLQIGYTIPSKVLEATGFTRIRLYFTATNLFTVSNFVPGWDPEVSKALTYPFSRNYSFGLNVQF